MDSATGLLYVGNGQYYDPATGRFLTRDANPNSPNPYVPFDPTGLLIGPLGLLALFYGRRKKGSKGGVLLVVLVFTLATGMALSACGPIPEDGNDDVIVTENSGTPPPLPGNGTPTPEGSGTVDPDMPTSTPLPNQTLILPECPTAPIATSVLSDAQWLQQMFGVELLNGSDALDNIWNTKLAGNARRAIVDVANKISRVTGDDLYTAFRKAFNTYSQNLVLKKVTSFTTIDGTVVTGGGYTNGPHLIHFAWIDYDRDDSLRNNIVHELGHAFNQGRSFEPEHGLPANYPKDRQLFLHNNDDPGVMWQSNDAQNTSETFADMFVAYTYDTWDEYWSDQDAQQELRRHNPADESSWNPPQWMDDYMRGWLN